MQFTYIVCFDKKLKLDKPTEMLFKQAALKGFISNDSKKSGIKKFKIKKGQMTFKIKVVSIEKRLWCMEEKIKSEYVRILLFNKIMDHKQQKKQVYQ